MKRKLLSVILTLMLLCLLIPFAASAEKSTSFTLTISNEQPEAGQEVLVSVKGHDLQDLYAYEVNLGYDPEQLRFKQAKSEISGMSITPIVKNGSIQFATTKIGNKAGENGDAVLCTLAFDVIGKGSTKVELNDVKLVSSQLASVTLKANAQVTTEIKGGKPAAFTDIAGHWAREAIEKAVKLGFVNGYEDHTFRPQGLVTRAEFTAMLTRALQITGLENAPLDFADADSIPQWASAGISAAVAAGIVDGYDDNTFRADNQINRAEMTALVVRALKLDVSSAAALTFSDQDQIPDWAAPYVATSVKAGLIQGRDGNLFAPLEQTTRAEAVTLILNAIQK
ncbi:S-layer homology domain-containing protein [Paenibacillus aceris]|uniref:SLH domain-containing protein n=1 Tax=Paenibacillus aceris TaxID=869555 RepID=A0ABS4I5G5_9BACL|nr:S-layer homology domain-containing protein [Paenibacillus aceris]MBP1965349.1 hypothetical protein [Paenibacillus aceris]NHW36032.1 hypothetical protein [Paenibacillus aceris]